MIVNAPGERVLCHTIESRRLCSEAFFDRVDSRREDAFRHIEDFHARDREAHIVAAAVDVMS